MEINGESVQLNSGHSYNRVHKTGDIRDSGFTMDQVDRAIVRDISSMSGLGQLPKAPFYDTRAVDMGGYKITYRAARVSSGAISVAT